MGALRLNGGYILRYYSRYIFPFYMAAALFGILNGYICAIFMRLYPASLYFAFKAPYNVSNRFVLFTIRMMLSFVYGVLFVCEAY